MNKRKGAKIFRFQFDVTIENIDLAISFGCNLSVSWKLGSRKAETISKPALTNGKALFNEKLTIQSKLYFDEQSKAFIEKKVMLFMKSQFTVIINTLKGNKVAGVCNLDFGAFVNNGVTGSNFYLEKKEKLKLERCPDKSASINLKIVTSLIGEINDYEIVSQTTNNISIEEQEENKENSVLNRSLAEKSVRNEQKLTSEITRNSISEEQLIHERKKVLNLSNELSHLKGNFELLKEENANIVSSIKENHAKEIEELNNSLTKLISSTESKHFEEINNLKAQRNALKSELEISRIKVSDLETKLKSYENQENELEALNSFCESLKKEISTISEKLKKQTSENVYLQSQLSKAKEKEFSDSESVKEREVLLQEIILLKEELSNASSELEQMRSQQLVKDLNSSPSSKSQIDSELKKLKLEISEERKLFANKMKEFSKKEIKMKDSFEECQRQLQEANARNKTLESQVTTFESQHKALISLKNEIDVFLISDPQKFSSASELLAQMTEIIESRNDLQKEKDHVISTMMTLTAEHDTLKQQLSESKAIEERFKRTIKELMERCKSLSQERDSLLETSKNFNEVVEYSEELVKKNKALTAEMAETKRKLEDLKPKKGFQKGNDELSLCQTELVKNKQMLGDVINMVFDQGESELAEKISTLLSNKKKRH